MTENFCIENLIRYDWIKLMDIVVHFALPSLVLTKCVLTLLEPSGKATQGLMDLMGV